MNTAKKKVHLHVVLLESWECFPYISIIYFNASLKAIYYLQFLESRTSSQIFVLYFTISPVSAFLGPTKLVSE